MANNRVGQNRAIPPAAASSKPSVPQSLREESAAGSGVREVILEGRRYRLVPVDDGSTPERRLSVASLLTAREFQIVALVADGYVNKQIAEALHISEWTVSTHLRRIFAKLGVDTRAAMVSRCVDLLAKRDG
jgi:DNA-binding CsgD family transcriptional regulator